MYIGFQTIDWIGLTKELVPGTVCVSNILKYLSVILCFFWQWGRKDRSLWNAQFLVLAADYLLLFTRYYSMGILFFLGVQWCYGRYLSGTEGPDTQKTHVQRKKLFSAAVYPALLYAGLFLNNVIISSRKALGRNRKQRCFSLGLWLLLFCDIHVALYNVSDFWNPFLAGWQKIAQPCIWMFYLPSQVLIALAAAGTEGSLRQRKKMK